VPQPETRIMKTWLYANRYGLTLIILAAIILLPFLGSTPLMNPDEPVYGETAREMLLSGDWLSPRIFGNYWYDKPPLFYWLEMISYALFGISDYTSRLPSALLGIATIGLVYRQCRAIFNQQIAFLSAMILLTSLGFLYVGKAAITDMSLLFTLTAAMLFFYRGRYYAAYACCGLALLAKGPVGYAFPALIMLLYIICRRRWSLLREMKIPQGILIAFAVGLPWYIAMYHVHGEAFLDTFIGYHNITRFAAPEHPGRNSILYYVPIFLGAMMPWMPTLFPALHRLWKKRDPFKDALLFCLIWAAFIFVFFSFSKTQLVTYIAPMFPPAAILMGWYLYRCRIERHIPMAALCIAYIMGVILLACNAIPLHDSAAFFHTAILWGSVLLASAVCIPAMLLYRRCWQGAFRAAVTSMVLFTWIAFAYVIPMFDEQISSYQSSQVLTRVYDGRSPIYAEKFLRPGMAFYSGIYGREWDDTKGLDFQALFTTPERTYVVMTRKAFGKLSLTQPVIQQFTTAGETPSQLILVNHE
jgi:4-amino-4-deoxy-L-arabinose transferase-like glycosyltransferase